MKKKKEGGGKRPIVRDGSALRGQTVAGAHRVALAVPDFSRGLEEKPGAFSGSENDINVARLGCGVCGGLQACVNGLKEVSLDEVVSDVAGCAKDGFKGGGCVRLREMWIHEGREEGPAGVSCAVDAHGGDASVLVEESGIHDREWQSGVGRPSRRGRNSDAGGCASVAVSASTLSLVPIN